MFWRGARPNSNTAAAASARLLYHEALEILQGLCALGRVAGEVAPPHDPAGITANLAAQLC